jgi:hypothetical protein
MADYNFYLNIYNQNKLDAGYTIDWVFPNDKTIGLHEQFNFNELLGFMPHRRVVVHNGKKYMGLVTWFRK